MPFDMYLFIILKLEFVSFTYSSVMPCWHDFALIGSVGYFFLSFGLYYLLPSRSVFVLIWFVLSSTKQVCICPHGMHKHNAVMLSVFSPDDRGLGAGSCIHYLKKKNFVIAVAFGRWR